MPLLNSYNNLLKKIWRGYSEDTGRSLIHLGAFGWFLSAAAQVTMIVRNKDIDKKEKQFLIPQEIADGLINVALYYTICKGIKSTCAKLLENGVFFTKRSFKTIMNIKPTPNSAADYIKAMRESFILRRVVKEKKSVGNLSDFYTGMLELLKMSKDDRLNIIKGNPMLKSTFDLIEQNNKFRGTQIMIKNAQKDFKDFKNGVGVIAAVGASVLACNLITPITRNLTANAYQKSALKRHQNKVKQNQTLPYTLPLSNTFNSFKI